MSSRTPPLAENLTIVLSTLIAYCLSYRAKNESEQTDSRHEFKTSAAALLAVRSAYFRDLRVFILCISLPFFCHWLEHHLPVCYEKA